VFHQATLLMLLAGAAVHAGQHAGQPTAKELPPLPQAVSSFGAAVSDGWLYVYGGHRAKTHSYSTQAVLGTFHRLKLSAPKTWQALPSGPPAQGLALVAHEGKLYRIGGMQPRNKPGDLADNHSLASCACFDPSAGTWQPLPDLPAPRSSHDAVVVGAKIVVVGGWKLNGAGKKSEWHSDALVLDLGIAPLEWRSIKQPFQRRALAAAAQDSKVYVIGGMTEESKTVLTTSILDPTSGAWTTGPDLPSPRRNGFSPGACSLGGTLYVSPSDGRLLRLGAKQETWEEAGMLKQPRIVHRMLPGEGNTLVVVGGAGGGDNIGLTEMIVPRPGKE
jgi:hypothetical protein